MIDMTPKEKAKELVDKFTVVGLQQRNEGIQCALIAVDFAKEFITGDLNESFDKALYLFEVKQEIEKL